MDDGGVAEALTPILIVAAGLMEGWDAVIVVTPEVAALFALTNPCGVAIVAILGSLLVQVTPELTSAPNAFIKPN